MIHIMLAAAETAPRTSVYGQKTTGQKTTKNAKPGQKATIVEICSLLWWSL